MLSISDWLRHDIEIPPPHLELITEIGVIISNRRQHTLSLALMIARWIFIEGSTAQKEAIAEFTLNGLGYLQEELRYDRVIEDKNMDLPLLRWRCAHLALNMTGFENHPSVAFWLDVSQNDPLPEVRFARPETEKGRL